MPARRGSVLFLSYNSADAELVASVSRLLEGRGITTFLDRQHLVAGRPWPEALEQALAEARAVAVFLGGQGFGTWQKREMWFALDRQARAEKGRATFPVIPVLLPGADPSAGFLFLNTWVDLRSDPSAQAAVERLVWALDEGRPPPPDAAVSLICPYRGLQPFGEEDSAFFCGREAFSERLLKATREGRVVALLGPSGSGKSSVVHAGLLPRLRGQRPPAAAWDAVSFTPGERPYHRLAAALLPVLQPGMSEVARLKESAELGSLLAGGGVRLEDAVDLLLKNSGGTDRLLVVADQFEELFTQTDEAARKRFAEDLLAATARAPVSLVLALRADFYDRALSLSRDLSDHLEGALVNLGPMRKEELARAIREPAERCGLDFEPGLVERILNDVGEEPGNLPLLEFALSELWAHRSGRRLTNDAYTASGGVAGAIAQRAEAELERLKPDEREAARELFTGLVRVTRPGEGGRDTGRRGRLDDLGETAKRVAAKLAGRESRLLITGLDEQGKSVVEVAHEALIQSWGQLRRWLDLDREFLLWRDRLRTYRSENQRTGTLLTGPPLTEAERWLNERRQHLNPSEVALIDDSIGARDATLLAQRRRRRWAALGGFGVAGLIALLGFDALRSGFKAARQAEVARAGSILAAQAAVEDPTVSALVLVELGAHGAPLPGNPLAAVRLAQATAVSPIARTILRGHQDVVWSAAFSPDGTRVVTASYDGTARVWRSDGSGRPIVLRGHTGSVRCAAFSPDGSRVVTASADRTARIWDANGLGNPIVLRGHTEELTGAAFSPNGSRVVTASADGTARLWDADGSGRYVVLKHGGAVRCASFSHDGSHLVTASDDGAARVWNAEGLGTPVILRTADSANYAVRDAAFSADGSRVVTASEDGTARVWQTDGVGTPVILRGHQGAVLHAAFSPDGSRVVTASRDRTARIWKADDSAAPIVLRGHLAAVEDATFERDGARVVTASEDGTAAIWKADGSGLPIVLRGHEGEVLQANLSPDGARVVTVSRDHTARIWNPGGTGEPVVLRGHTDIVLKAAFSRDGSQIVTASVDATARVWHADGSGTPIVLRGHNGLLRSATFSPDGARILTASADGTARIWRLDDLSKPVVFRREWPVESANFSPNGSRIVTSTIDGTAWVWNAEGSGEPFALSGHNGPVSSAAFSPDGSHIVTASNDHTARVWSVGDRGDPVVLRRHEGDVWSAAFNSDGSRVVTASQDHTAIVWHADGTGKPVVLRGHDRALRGACFSRDDSRVLTFSLDGTARVWNTDGTGDPVVLSMPGQDVTDAAFSPDGSTVVTALADGTARLWNADGSGVQVVLRGHDASVLEAVFSPDGSRLVTASADHTVRVWRVSWTALLDHLRQSTNACLTPRQRTQYLGEPPAAAVTAFAACEHQYGRPAR